VARQHRGAGAVTHDWRYRCPVAICRILLQSARWRREIPADPHPDTDAIGPECRWPPITLQLLMVCSPANAASLALSGPRSREGEARPHGNHAPTSHACPHRGEDRRLASERCQRAPSRAGLSPRLFQEQLGAAATRHLPQGVGEEEREPAVIEVGGVADERGERAGRPRRAADRGRDRASRPAWRGGPRAPSLRPASPGRRLRGGRGDAGPQ
jgi:hypothetical protein